MRGLRRFAGLTVLAGTLVSCPLTPGAAPEGAVIACADDGGCPTGWECDVTLRRCTRGGLAADPEPPYILSPVDGAVLRAGSVTLAWEPVQLATEYAVWIGDGPDEADALPMSPLFVSAPATTLEVSLDDDVSYWWKVRANVTRENEWSEARVEVVGDALHVHCPESVESCSDSIGAGNRTNPHQTVQAAIEAAEALGISQVKVARRGGGLPYTGLFTLAPGVSLGGGWDVDFSAVGDPTHLLGTGAITVLGININTDTTSSETVIEGFDIATGDIADSVAIHVSNSDSKLIIRDNIVRALPSEARGQGILIAGGEGTFAEGPLIERCTVMAAEGAVRIALSAARLIDCELRTGYEGYLGHQTVVELANASATVRGNTLSADSSFYEVKGLWVTGYDGIPTIEGNTIDIDGGGEVFGVLATGFAGALRDNVVTVAGASRGAGIDVRSGSEDFVEVEENVVSVTASSSFSSTPLVGMEVSAVYGSSARVAANSVAVTHTGSFANVSTIGLRLEVLASTSNGPGEALAINNLVRAGVATTSTPEHVGIQVEQSSYSTTTPTRVLLVNNTVDIRNSTADPAIQLATRGGALEVEMVNNLLVGAGTTSLAVDQADPEVTLVAMENNTMAGFIDLYRTPVATSSDISALTAAVQASGGRASDNVDLFSRTLVGFAAADDYHLTASSPATVRSGGLDTSQNRCGAAGDQSCGGVTEDLEGRPRSCPVASSACYSIGAYELD